MALAADACHACRAGSEEAKVRPVELCSTDSGTSYSSATSGGSSERPTGAGLVDPRCTNLNFFHDFARIEEMIGKGSFTKRKELSSCCRGEGQVELHLWSGEGEKLVVVKRLPAERVRVNQGQPASEQELFQRSISRSSEDVLAEIGVFSYLGQCEKLPAYILEMLFALQMDQEVWLVLEHAEGGDLFNVISKRPPSKELLLLWAWQLLQAVAFLHQQGICHRDISLENILLSGGDIRLMDFGQAVQSSEAGQLLLYFWAIGKPYYRPPETYIPSSSTFEVMMPPGLSSGQVTLAKTPSQDFLCHVRVLDVETATAEPYGYTAPPVDVFETGVSILIMFFAAPPWRQARPNDTYFKWVQSNGLQALAKSWKKALPEPVGELLKRMLHLDAEQRPSAQECLAQPCFAALHSAPVALRTRAAEPPATPAGPAPPAGVADAPRLAGDCYREPEWVCRSAEDDSLDVGSELLLGDPYHDMQLLGGAFEAAPVQRGAAQAARCAAAPETVGLPVLELLREDRTEIAQIDAAFFAHG